jgi:hypothetical protein
LLEQAIAYLHERAVAHQSEKMAYESQVPLPVEVMDLVSQSAGALGSEAECVEMGIAPCRFTPTST